MLQVLPRRRSVSVQILSRREVGDAKVQRRRQIHHIVGNGVRYKRVRENPATVSG